MEMLPLTSGSISPTDSTCWLNVHPVGLKATSWSYWLEKRAKCCSSFWKPVEKDKHKVMKNLFNEVYNLICQFYSSKIKGILRNINELFLIKNQLLHTVKVSCIMGRTWTRAAFQSVVIHSLTCSDSRQHMVLYLSLDRHTLDPRTSARAVKSTPIKGKTRGESISLHLVPNTSRLLKSSFSSK